MKSDPLDYSPLDILESIFRGDPDAYEPPYVKPSLGAKAPLKSVGTSEKKKKRQAMLHRRAKRRQSLLGKRQENREVPPPPVSIKPVNKRVFCEDTYVPTQYRPKKKGGQINYPRPYASISTIPSINQILALHGDEQKQKAEAAKLGREWVSRGGRSVNAPTLYALNRFKKAMRNGLIRGGLTGDDYWRFIHTETVDWIAEGGYCNSRYLSRKDFAAKLHASVKREFRR